MEKYANNRGFAAKFFLIVMVFLMVAVLVIFFVRERRAETGTVAGFYSQYLEEGKINEEMMTEELSVIVKEMGPSSFLCAELIPDNVSIEKIEENDGIFMVYASHLENPIKVTIDNSGKMAHIQCPVKEETRVVEVSEQVPATQETRENQDNPTIVHIQPVLRAKNDLATRLNIDLSKIQVKSAEAVIFSDSTLGTSAPGEVYDQRMTPGYLIILSANEKDYRYHADETRIFFIQ